MDMDFPVDLAEYGRRIEDAEVLSVYFPMLGKTLLLDLRYTADIPPFIRVVSSARGPEERLRYLRRTRPGLPRPTDLTAMFCRGSSTAWSVWASSSGCWSARPPRGHPSAVQACREALRELQQLERAELASGNLRRALPHGLGPEAVGPTPGPFLRLANDPLHQVGGDCLVVVELGGEGGPRLGQ